MLLATLMVSAARGGGETGSASTGVHGPSRGGVTGTADPGDGGVNGTANPGSASLGVAVPAAP